MQFLNDPRVHWVRNALAHVPKGQHTVVAAAIRQAFLQPDRESASQTWRHVADQLRARWPKLGTLMDDSETDVLAYMSFPASHRTCQEWTLTTTCTSGHRYGHTATTSRARPNSRPGMEARSARV